MKPESCIVFVAVLQLKILERMRSLGMITVLPAFSGNIPKGILRWAGGTAAKVHLDCWLVHTSTTLLLLNGLPYRGHYGPLRG